MARTSKFLYQTTLAEEIGVSSSYLSKIESGDRVLSAALMCKIAIALGVSEASLNPYRSIDSWGTPQLPIRD